jgi:hypothetical protein
MPKPAKTAPITPAKSADVVLVVPDRMPRLSSQAKASQQTKGTAIVQRRPDQAPIAANGSEMRSNRFTATSSMPQMRTAHDPEHHFEVCQLSEVAPESVRVRECHLTEPTLVA